MKTKPIKYWLNRLPWGIRELALEARRHDDLVCNKTEAVLHMCYWSVSEMGHDFWCAVYRDAYFNENGKEFGE